MAIQTKAIPELQLTIHLAEKVLLFEELMETLRNFYKGKPTVKVLWDLRAASLTSLTADQMRTAIHFAAQHAATRVGGKTALLVSVRLGDYGMGRMAEIMSHIEAEQITVILFRDYEEAMQWLAIE